MKGYRFSSNIFITLLFFISHATFADNHSYQINIFGGVNHSDVNSDNLFFQTGEIDSLHKDNMANHATGGLGIAYRTIMMDHPISIGLDWIYLYSSNDGLVYQNKNPNLANYRYNLDLNTSRFMIDFEMQFCEVWQKLTPFVQLGAGLARTTIDYQDKPVPNSGVNDGAINIQQKTNYTPALSFALGVKRPVTENIEAFASYQVSDLGSVKTSRQADILTLAKPLEVSLHTQALFIGIHYLIG